MVRAYENIDPSAAGTWVSQGMGKGKVSQEPENLQGLAIQYTTGPTTSKRSQLLSMS